MLTASTSLWYLYALVVYFTLCKLLPLETAGAGASGAGEHRDQLPAAAVVGMNSVVRNMIYYSLGAWYGAELMAWMKGLSRAAPGCPLLRLPRYPLCCGLPMPRYCSPCCRCAYHEALL
jgi:uncharacterized membrane protein YcfT